MGDSVATSYTQTQMLLLSSFFFVSGLQ